MKIQLGKNILLSVLLLASSITAQTPNIAYLSYIDQKKFFWSHNLMQNLFYADLFYLIILISH